MKKLTLLLLVCTATIAYADVRLPAILGDHMVLQQKTNVKFWGWCNTTEKISINAEWDSTTYKTEGDGNGKWELTIPTPAAGGPYIIYVKGDNKIVINDVLVGEVWDCSGQSNMEMSDSWGKQLYTEELSHAHNQQIRLLYMPRSTAEYPQEDSRAHWVVCNPEDVKTFSMAGYFFGKQLQQTLQVPVGLINANWGGTPVETWTPADSIDNNAYLQNAANKLKVSKWWPVKPGYAYNGMVHPNINFNIAGVIWYQGEANVGTYESYAASFGAMIDSWRRAWHKNLPFYYVQIAPFEGYGKSNNASLLREQQTLAQAIPHTGMIVVSDLVDDIKDIHPKNKKDVGLRLANMALTKTYGVPDLVYKYPSYKNMKIEKDRIRIYFNDAEKGLMQKGDAIDGFYIAGNDKVFVPAQAVIDGNSVVVYNSSLKDPVALRFGFTSSSMPNLFSKEGLPVNLFRTDDWDDVPTVQ